MDLQELDQELKRLGIPNDHYYLHGIYGSSNDDDKLALIKKAGKYSIEYECYFKERGEKHSIRIFNSENEACLYIRKLFTENPNG